MKSLSELGLIKIGGPRTCCGAAQVEHVGLTCEQVRERRRETIRRRLGPLFRAHLQKLGAIPDADNIDING